MAAIEAEHRKPRRRPRSFADEFERAAFLVDQEIDTLIPLIPAAAELAMMGGKRGVAQVPDPAERRDAIRRKLKARAGSDGDKLASVRGALCKVRSGRAALCSTPGKRQQLNNVLDEFHARQGKPGHSPGCPKRKMARSPRV